MMRALLIGYGKMGHLIAHLAPQYGIAISGVVHPHLKELEAPSRSTTCKLLKKLLRGATL